MNVPTLRVNPVLRRELVERMRGRRAAVVITLYLLVLSGILYLVYGVARDTRVDPWQSAVSQFATAGRGVFGWLVFFMLLLVLFLVPGITSGAIAGERERQTLVPLQVTLLRPRSILFGKVAASLAFLMLLIVATAPLLAVSYLIGGVSTGQVLKALGMVAFTGVVLACISAGISACVRRVQMATVLAYGATLALAVGTLLAYAGAGAVDASRGNDAADPPMWILAPNPFAAMADVIAEGTSMHDLTTSTPFDWMARGIDRQRSGGVEIWDEMGANGAMVRMAVDMDGNLVDLDSDVRPLWPQSIATLTVTALAGTVIGARRLRTPTTTER